MQSQMMSLRMRGVELSFAAGCMPVSLWSVYLPKRIFYRGKKLQLYCM